MTQAAISIERKISMSIKALAMALALAPGGVSAAHATETILFTITGGDPKATFVLPESPYPGSYDLFYSFDVGSVPAVVAGVSTTLINLSFYSNYPSGLGSNAGLSDTVYYNLFGPQLYGGFEFHPTFVPSVYTGFYNEYTGNYDTVTLTVTNVPEASTWVMMLAGFAGLGFLGYRRNEAANAP
jgi:hypothetical protein